MRIRAAVKPLAWTLLACILFSAGWAAFVITDPFAGHREQALQQQLRQHWRAAAQPRARQANQTELTGRSWHPDHLRLVTGQPFALIRVPALGAQWQFAIVQGSSLTQLALGPGHVPGTGLPGQPGNFVVAAHDVTAGNPFLHLRTLHYPDKVYIYTKSWIYEYVVHSERVVRYTDTAVEYPVPGHPGEAPHRSFITLITCTPVTLAFTPVAGGGDRRTGPRDGPALANGRGSTVTRYTFQDEFDGPAGSPPDPARWCYDLGGGGWGNNELQTYTDSTANVFQDGRSHLVIRATQEQRPAAGHGRPAVSYHSARITTRNTFAQQGGCFEARIKVTSQRGLWPAFWLMGQDIGTAGWPRCGEVDVLEDFGYATVQSSVHAPAGGISVHSVHQDLPSDTGWHTYRLDWSANGMSFSRDGRRYLIVRRAFCGPQEWVYGPAEPHNGGMFLLLNLAVGGNVGDPPDSTQFPADLMVDYVRVTQS